MSVTLHDFGFLLNKNNLYVDRFSSWFCAINGRQFNPRWLNFLILKLELRLKIANVS